jgi:hypothetical protein
MKNLLPAIVIFLGINAHAQTKADYEQTIRQIGKYYNLKKTDSLLHMYAAAANKADISVWTGREIDELRIRNGKIVSYDYAGIHDGITLFRAEFARSTHIMGLLLDSDNKLLVFRFKVGSSLYIDSLLR